MSKLDEIEARLKRTEPFIGDGVNDLPLILQDDMTLLIRAVRQFWELAEARRGERAFAKLDVYNEENWRKASDRLNNAVRLDPNVLELIGPDREPTLTTDDLERGAKTVAD